MASLGFIVLPFGNTSGEPDQDYIGAALTSHLIGALSTVKDTVVIAENSAREIATQSLSIAEIGRRFGVGFVLRGTESLNGDNLRVSASLLRTADEAQLWSDQFDFAFVKMRETEQKIVASIAQHVNGELVDGGRLLSSASAPDAVALDSLLRANAVAARPTTSQTLSEAARLYSRALRDPMIGAEAKAGLAAVHLAVALNSRTPLIDLRECERLLQEALAAEPHNGQALNTLGALRRATGKPADALNAYEAAIAADRNDANAHAQIGRLMIDLGKANRALQHIELALRLSPLDAQRSLWFTYAGLALLHTGETEDARSWLEKAVAAAPQFVTAQVFFAAAQQLAGHSDDAQRTMAAARQRSPALSITRIEQQFAPHDRDGPQWSRIRDSMRQAGLPN